MRNILPLVLLGLMFSTALYAQEPYPIGTRGARIELNGDWNAGTIRDDVGGDQFMGRRGLAGSGLIIMEVSGVFRVEEDFREDLEVYSVGIVGALEGARTSDITFAWEGENGHANQKHRGTLMGTQFVFNVHIVGRDGLAYVFLAFCAKNGADKLEESMDELLASFRMPTRDSDWARSTAPMDHSIRLYSQYILTVQAQPSIFQPVPDLVDEGDLSLQDEFAVIAAFAWEMERSNLTELEQETRDALGTEDYVLQSREEIELQGYAGSRMMLTSVEATVEVFLLELTSGRFLEARFVSSGSPDRHRVVREELIQSMSIWKMADIGAIPEPAPDPYTPIWENSYRNLLDQGVAIAEVMRDINHVIRTPEGLAMGGSGRLEVLVEGSDKSELKYQGDWSACQTIVYRNGEFWTNNAEKERVRIRRGVAKAYSPGLSPFAQTPDGFWLATASPKRRPIGLGLDSYQPSITDLILVTGSDTSQTIPFPHGEITAMDLHQGTALLVVHHSDNYLERKLYTYDLESVAHQKDGSLLLASWVSEEWSSDARATLFRFDLEDVRVYGPSCAPFTAAKLGALGAEVATLLQLDIQDPTCLSSQKAILTFAETARTIGAEQGINLPVTLTGVDNLINRFSLQHDLGPAGLLLLAALCSEKLLEEGAIWLEGENPNLGMHAFSRGEESQGNAVAIAYHPYELVTLTGLPDTEWWNPISSALFYADGRTVVLGTDHHALQDAILNENLSIPHLAQEPVSVINQALEDHEENLFLRQRIYHSLAQQERFSDVAVLAEGFVSVTYPELMDLKAFFGARLQQGLSSVDRIRPAVARFPNDMELLLLLGHSYQLEGSLKHARRCFEYVQDEAWGVMHEAAKDALDRMP